MSWNFGILDMVKEKLGIVSNENDNESNEFEITFTESSLGITVENVNNKPTISKVITGSIGQLKGLHIGDIIIRVSNFNIDNFNDFSNVISSFPERPLVIRFYRPGFFFSSSNNTSSNKNQVLLSEEEKEERRKAMVQAAFERDKYKNITTNSQKNNSKKSSTSTSTSSTVTSSNNVSSAINTNNDNNNNNGKIENQEITKLIESVKREEARVVQEMGYDPFKPHMSSQSQARSQISRVVHGDMMSASLPSANATAMSTSTTPSYGSHNSNSNNNNNIANVYNHSSNNNSNNNYTTSSSSVPATKCQEITFPISDNDSEQVELALSLLLSHPVPCECESVLRTLLKILSSLYANPNDAKLRTIRIMNPGFQKKVIAYPGGMELLLAAGFYITEMKSEVTTSTSTSTNSNTNGTTAMDVEDTTTTSNTTAAVIEKEGDDEKEESYLRHNCHVSHESMALLKYTLERINEVLSLSYSQNKTSTSTFINSIEDSDASKSSTSTSIGGSGKVLGYKNPPTSTSTSSGGSLIADTKREAMLKAVEARNNNINNKGFGKSKRK